MWPIYLKNNFLKMATCSFIPTEWNTFIIFTVDLREYYHILFAVLETKSLSSSVLAGRHLCRSREAI